LAKRSVRGRTGGKHFQLKLLPVQLQYLRVMLDSLRGLDIHGPIVTLAEKVDREASKDASVLGYHQLMLTAKEASALNDWYSRIQDEKIVARVREGSYDPTEYEDITEDYEDVPADTRVLLVPVRDFVEDLVETRAPELSQSHYLLDSLFDNVPTQITR